MKREGFKKISYKCAGHGSDCYICCPMPRKASFKMNRSERDEARALVSKKHSCECGEMATWLYPGLLEVRVYCDACVPRGCSCNDHMVSEPCVDYMYDENGFDE